MDILSFILGLQKGKSMGGGGSSADVRYVTFIGADGATLIVKPVAVGDDCVDVAAKGLISTPTKESDVYYTYTFAGWAATIDGEANDSILKNITADKTVYAVFDRTTVYYTVRFFDGDTCVDTVQVTYGQTATTSYGKNGYSLVGWTPSPENITQDTDCYGEWIELISFGGCSWNELVEICESGRASTTFNIGDTREIVNGDYSYTMRIIGFNFDDKADSSGKAGITVAITNSDGSLVNSLEWYGPTVKQVYWNNLNNVSYNYCNTEFYNTLPDYVQSAIKKVSKPTAVWHEGNDKVYTYKCNVFLLSVYEVGCTGYYLTAQETLGAYPWFATASNRILGVEYWLRNHYSNEAYYVGTSGTAAGSNGVLQHVRNTNVKGIYPCFCI